MMKVDSLDELRSAYAEWRKRKKHAREAVPDELIARAQRAAKKHGAKAVVRVTRLDRSRLFRSQPERKAARSAQRREAGVGPRSVPAFSRLELEAPPTAGPRALAEVETVAGVKLRVFELTPEMIGLLSQVCGFGGPR
jgi:hypothetical protein